MFIEEQQNPKFHGRAVIFKVGVKKKKFMTAIKLWAETEVKVTDPWP